MRFLACQFSEKFLIHFVLAPRGRGFERTKSPVGWEAAKKKPGTQPGFEQAGADCGSRTDIQLPIAVERFQKLLVTAPAVQPGNSTTNSIAGVPPSQWR